MADDAPVRSDAGNIRRVSFVSLGCPKNLVDSETMLGTLAEAGFELVSDGLDTDAVVINTCGFLEASREESLEVICEQVERKKRGEIQRVVVAGCLVQRHRAKLLEWAPGIDAMIGVFDRDHVIDAVQGRPQREMPVGNGIDSPRYWIAANAMTAARERGISTVGLTVKGVASAEGRGLGYFEDDSMRFRLTPRHWAYLRVSEGCNQRCTFCTIPSIRGKMRSKPLDRIIDEARALLDDGAFELNLIGQDTTSYGYDIYGRPGEPPGETPGESPGGGGEGPAGHAPPSPYSGDLIGLLTALNDVAAERSGSKSHSGNVPGGAWMRLMYVYPTYFTDDMIDAIASLANIVKYIDIPLQHISDRMLKAMRRNITRAQQEELLYKLRERIPGLAIRTTLITGFPGETENDHEELLEFIDEFRFDHLGVFRYSREDGTPAGRMDLDPELHVPDEVKRRREHELMSLQQQIAFDDAAYLAEEACQFDVLIDAAYRPPGKPPGGASESRGIAGAGAEIAVGYVGRCYHQAPQVDSVTYVGSDRPLAPGDLVRCTIVGSVGYDLIARPTNEL